MRMLCLLLPGLLLLLILAASCTGGPSAELQQQQAPVAAAGGGLPSLPADRTTLGMQQYLLLGSDSYISAGALEVNTTTELSADSGLAFAAYGFGPLDGIPDNLLVLLDVEEGSEIWLALGDFAAGRWELSGPYGASTGLNLSPAKHLSSFGGVYVAVIAEPGNRATVNALSLNAFDTLNAPPLAELTIDPVSGTAPLAATLSASGSMDDKGIELYLWDFDGDGNYEEISTVPSAQHVYSEPGQYLTALLVLDSEGSQDSDFALVSVNAAPVASLTALPSAEVWPGDTLQLVGSGSFDSDGEIVAYEWELDGDGDFNDEGGNKASFPYIVLEEPGYHDIALRVMDDSGAQDTASLRLTVKGISGGTVPGGEQTGIVSSMIVADGFPMIAYAGADGDLKFIRGADSVPAAWLGTANDLAEEPGISSLSLRLINGKPAVAFSAALNNEQFPPHTLKYVIAADPLGESWQPSVDLELDGLVSPDSLRTVRGWPGIAYWDEDENALCFVRPQDPNGNSWAEPFLVSSENFAPHVSLMVVSGRPAIAAFRPVDGVNCLFYLYSNDEFGTSWPGGIVVDDDPGHSTKPSLALIDGRPAIAYRRGGSDRLLYVRALDAAGSAWGQALDLAQLDGAVKECSLTLVGGLPAIAFTAEAGQVHLIQAVDAGGTNWDSSMPIAPASTAGPSISLADLEGRPAVSLRAADNDLQFFSEY